VIPRLHLVLDLAVAEQAGRDPVAVAMAAVRGGAGAVHVRAPSYGAGAILAVVQALRAALEGRALLLVNDRLDVALAGDADGVHLPQAGLAPDMARAVVAGLRGSTSGPRQPRSIVTHNGALAAPDRSFVVGVSVHTPEDARQAERSQADYALLGTVYPSASHPGGSHGDPALVRAARAVTRLPLIAIGGITPENAEPVLDAGATGIAVIRAIVAAADPEGAAAALRRVLDVYGDRPAVEAAMTTTTSTMAGTDPG
jgi:thiamine monophosphate synthase